ncbi:hypothetical protein [Mahella australiensis]|uniref:Phage head morphogenesis domain-containing protein n=1 Tax=Mahella australiensis (strain DSM 15567 / CIP 107919 / 50-1 BON) TaxID=697281 RepID=F3ZVE8_MAHA5|nr:hypothetical protein [Mahella australiensis]AEE95298.1 hypothetical protein Mahau_0075 [Mahella australiensis 50-1 BON]
MPTVWNKKDWELSGSEQYAEYLLDARKRFLEHNAATVEQIQQVYKRAAEDIASDIKNVAPGTLRYNHLSSLQKALEERARTINEKTLDAIYNGIRLTTEDGTLGAQMIMQDLFKYDRAGVKSLFADINERAVLAVLSRTGKDGLKLSDRIWRTGEHVNNNLKVMVEDAVARGLDSRELAKQVQQYMQPGKWTAMKKETRRRLGVSSNVSYEAMRLARTEMSHAYHEATILANQSSPSYMGIIWMLSGSHPLPDVCDDYASHNGDGFWPKGSEPPLPHPQCLCVALPKHERPDAFVERLRNWAQNPASDNGLEQWYNNIASKYISRPPSSDAIASALRENVWVSTIKRNIKDAPLDDRKALAEYLRDMGGFKYAVKIDHIKDRGLTSFTIQDGTWYTQDLILQSDDPRPYRYQIKTVFHETIHARMDSVQLTVQEQMIFDNNKILAYKLEDTIAEVIAHYMVKEAGNTEEITPAYSGYLIQILPSLKKMPEFKDCETIADFGEQLAKYRFGASRKAGWEEINKAISTYPIDVTQYAKQYEQYVKDNMDSIVEAIMDNQGLEDSDLRAAVRTSIENGWENYDINELGFQDSLIIAMNRLGVK